MRLEDTASTPEIVWTVAVTLALMVSGWALYDALWDLYAAKRRNRNVLRKRVWVIARANVRREMVQCIVQLLLLMLGVAALLTLPMTLPVWFAPGIFIAVAVILAVNSIFDRADRHILLRVIRRNATEKPKPKDFA